MHFAIASSKCQFSSLGSNIHGTLPWSHSAPPKGDTPPRLRPPPILPLLLGLVSIRRSLTLKYALALEKRYIKFCVLFSALWCHIGNRAEMFVGLGKTRKFSFRECVCVWENSIWSCTVWLHECARAYFYIFREASNIYSLGKFDKFRQMSRNFQFVANLFLNIWKRFIVKSILCG